MSKNIERVDDEILKVLNDPDVVRAAMQTGINAALLRHKQLGHPICVWRNGEVVWIEPEEINIDREKK